MAELYPLVIFYGFLIYGYISARPILIYMYFMSIPFGSMAALPPELLGGLTLTATPIVSLLIIAKTFLRKQNYKRLVFLIMEFTHWRIFFIFWLVALFITYFSPRIFAGEINVIPLRGASLSETFPLEPTVQNFSQMVLLSISMVSVFAFAFVLRSINTRQHAFKAMVAGAFVLVLTGIIDYSTQFLDISSLLIPFRTATYALAVDVMVFDSKRVVGFMPEASSFGGVCLFYLLGLYFFRKSIYDRKLGARYIPVLCVLLVIMILIAKSSSAYVGGAIFLSILLLRRYILTIFVLDISKVARIYIQNAFIVYIVVLLVLVAFLFEPGFVSDWYLIFDRMILQKSSSGSFEERGLWRDIAISTIVNSYGLGVGVGSTRASSSLVAIFSQTGILGGALYYAFIARLMLRQSATNYASDKNTLVGFRWFLLPIFTLSLLVGSTANFGPFMAFVFGLVLAITTDFKVLYPVVKKDT